MSGTRRVHRTTAEPECQAQFAVRERVVSLRLKLQIFFFLVFFLPGAFSVGYSLKLLASTVRLTGEGITTTGAITGYERQENLRRVGRRFCPIVEFYHDGSLHQFIDDWCNKSQMRNPPGSAVNVIFRANNPSTARINEFMVLYGKSLFIGVIGSPFLLLGIVLVFRVR